MDAMLKCWVADAHGIHSVKARSHRKVDKKLDKETCSVASVTLILALLRLADNYSMGSKYLLLDNNTTYVYNLYTTFISPPSTRLLGPVIVILWNSSAR